ncbi:MAG: dihydrodipicolinate synthase family protein [Gemmatimonadetes bacterium]|nr:dihydrodipicolinate synthase family protein [Gemmatimonadota bacterium]
MSDPDIEPRLQGIFLPVTTPFDEVTGDIAPVHFRENLRRYVQEPIDGILLCGSTGEGALLEEAEKVRLTSFAREVVPPRIVLAVGANTDSTRGTIRQVKRLAAEGAEVALVHPPVYFAPSLGSSAILEFYRDVAGASPIPILVYHMPRFTHVVIEGGLMGEITRLDNVLGLKDSSGDIKRFADYTAHCPAGSRLFVGSGALLYTALELGAVGGILAIADIAPAACAEVYSRFREGDNRRAGEVQDGLADLHRDVVAAFGATGVKTALDMIGWVGGAPRPPLQPLGEKERKQVARALQAVGLGAAV